MKEFNKNSVLITVALFVVLVAFGPAGSIRAIILPFTPSLGVAGTYGVLADTYTNPIGPNTINGDVGFTTGPAVLPLGGHPSITYPNYGSGAPYSAAGAAQAAALSDLNSQDCTYTFPSGAVDLAADTTHIPLYGSVLGEYIPGVYCTSGAASAMSIGTAGITLNGAGTYVFRSDGALNTVTGSHVTLNGASACDVFWTPNGATTLNHDSTFKGTVIPILAAAHDITIYSGVAWVGRALTFGHTVTTPEADVTITVPTCSATLNVIKHVINDNGGSANASNFSTTISGVTTAVPTATGVESPGVANVLTSVGSYSVDEGAHVGYNKTLSAECSGTVAFGQTKTCTITNDDQAPSLTLDKVVVNNNGGVAAESAWTLTATGPTTISGPGAAGSADVVSGATFSAGTYALSESAGPAGYAASSWSCVKNGGVPITGSSITLGLGDTATCTITNDDIAPGPATLQVIKQVVNNNGGSATTAQFNLHVKLSGTDVAGSPAVGLVSPGRSYTLSAGTYVVSEDTFAGYSRTFSGDCDSSGSVTLSAGNNKTCTITNDDMPASINVVKTVVNDNGETKVVADFPLFVNGTPVVSGVTNVFSAPAAYTVTETVDSHYTRTFSGDCDVNGHINLILGDSKFCVITNNDIAPTAGGSGSRQPTLILPVPPLIDVVKVPSPLALPAGPGPVIYSYTLRNIGTVPMTNITMVGDTCSPITLVSGDTNADAKLDVNETWIYRCPTTLTATHTNTVVATGWANGLSATDIANATVVVGLPIVPPLIHVTKVPNPLTLLSAGGMITYTERITNPGAVALSNVRLVDDKCAPLKYISGDANGDSKLDTAETWVYTCRTSLTKTTTNTAIASGEANGLAVRDFAIATVVVAAAVPKLPNTGLPPAGESTPWGMVLFFGIFILAFTPLVVVLKKRAI